MLRVARAAKKKSRRTTTAICAAATKIVQLAVRDDVGADEIGAIVMSDPVLGMRVLALVNSSAFMLPNRIADVRQAVALLGVRGLRNLALSLVVSDMAPSSKEGQLLLANSLRRALASQAIARAMDLPKTDAYFTAGLFLDVGLMVTAREDLEGAAEIARGPSAHRVICERAAGKEGHPTLGARMAREYQLPDEIVDAIEKHHDAEPPEQPLARACWLGERFAGVFEGGDLVAAKNSAVVAAKKLGITIASSERIFSELPEHVSEAAAAFDRDIGDQPDFDALVADANESLVSLNEHYEGLVRQLQQLVDEKQALEQELRAANRRLSEQATTDELTGLPNKRALLAALTRDLARATREGTPVSLVMVDVDHFKNFNDSYGHSTGDEVLRCVGALLLQHVRAGDVPARYGGEEFTLVLPNTDAKGALVAAERIREALEAMKVDGPRGKPLSVTASFGIATAVAEECVDASERLFEAADAALYDAKKAGRNRVCLAA